jgi:RNA-directed DNA polymerase
MLDPDFSQHSHGFRPGHRAHDAISRRNGTSRTGSDGVVDVDLEQLAPAVPPEC